MPWEEALNHIQLGGERGNGWGMVRSEIKPEKVNDNYCDGYELNEGQLYIQVNNKELFKAHVLADKVKDCQGVLEPLIGRDTNGADIGKGFGALITSRICWMPGTAFTGDTKKFKIEPMGIWSCE